MVSQIKEKELRLLDLLADDYSFLCNIPVEYIKEVLPGFQCGDEVPIEVRKELEISMVEIYGGLLKGGLIEAYRQYDLSKEPCKLTEASALAEISNINNYDHRRVTWPVILVAISDEGMKILEEHHASRGNHL